MRPPILILTACLLLGLRTPACADNTSSRPHIIVPQSRVAPIVTADPADPAWLSAAVIPALTLSPGDDNNGFSAMPTEVRLLWDQDNLYVRFICTATETYAPLRKHDADLYRGDVAEVFLDIKGDSKQWFEIEVSPYNATLEQLTTLTADPESDSNLLLSGAVVNRDWWPDRSFDPPGLRTAASIQKSKGSVSGWIVDMALPATPMLHRVGEIKYGPMTLRANFVRYEYPRGSGPNSPRRLMAMNWAPVVFGCSHISPKAMGYVDLSISQPAKQGATPE